jgi:hypothetical protein
MQMTRRIQAGRLAFAAAVAVSIAAGAQTAFARPVAAESREAVCYGGACHRECREHGWVSGTCIGGQTGWCECWE